MNGRESAGAATEEAWSQVREVLGSLGATLRDHYAAVAGPDGPSEEQVRGALRTLGEAFEQMIESLGSAFRDPAVRDQARKAAGSVVTAIGATFGDVGEELTRVMDADEAAGAHTDVPRFRRGTDSAEGGSSTGPSTGQAGV